MALKYGAIDSNVCVKGIDRLMQKIIVDEFEGKGGYNSLDVLRGNIIFDNLQNLLALTDNEFDEYELI